MSDIITYRNRIEVGCLIRRDVRRSLYTSAFNLGLTITIQEDNGWLDSVFYITLVGERELVRRFYDWMITLNN